MRLTIEQQDFNRNTSIIKKLLHYYYYYYTTTTSSNIVVKGKGKGSGFI